MDHREQRRTVCATIILVAVAIAFGGCANTRLYNKSEADFSAGIKAKYAETDFLGTIEVQKNNLDALLAEELKVVRENHQLQVDFALLEIADNDSPMAETWHDEIELPRKRLGFKEGSDLRSFSQILVDVDVADQRMVGLRRRIKKRAKIDPPLCPDLPDELKLPQELDDNTVKVVKNQYKNYKAACEKKKEALKVLKPKGKLAAAIKAWEDAKTNLSKLDEGIGKAKRIVDQADEEYGKAFKAAEEAGKKGEELRNMMEKEAEKLRSALEKANALAPQIVSEERISSIVVLLLAAASEQTNVENDPELAKAVLMVGGLSSLSGDIAGLISSAKAPNVGNLLIELQHQTVLLDHAKALRTLQERRADILKAKYWAYLQEAELILDFQDAMCSFAFRSDKKGHPGTKCDTFEVLKDGEICETTEPGPKVSIDPCQLSASWKEVLKNPPKGDAARELYKALAAYTQLFPVRSSQIEQDFHLIDLKHRENLAAREMSLRAWNNLASVPIAQLDAYFQSGLKPEAIADLIVKALGFTAITVGVSQ